MHRKTVVILLTGYFILSIFSGCMEEQTDLFESKNLVTIQGKGSYSSIQEAVDHAVDGDTIHVNPGKYYETVVINKSIKLIGEGVNKTSIVFKENNVKAKIICVQVNNCTISGFRITNEATHSEVTGVSLKSSNNVIANNTIVNAYIGVYVTGVNRKSASNNNILRNTIINTTRGVYLSAGAAENNVSANIISSSAEFGVILLSASNNILHSNNISSAGKSGVYIGFRSKYNVILMNNISKCNEAVELRGAEHNKIYKNIFYKNKKDVETIECCGVPQGTNSVYQNIVVE